MGTAGTTTLFGWRLAIRGALTKGGSWFQHTPVQRAVADLLEPDDRARIGRAVRRLAISSPDGSCKLASFCSVGSGWALKEAHWVWWALKEAHWVWWALKEEGIERGALKEGTEQGTERGALGVVGTGHWKRSTADSHCNCPCRLLTFGAMADSFYEYLLKGWLQVKAAPRVQRNQRDAL